jgi:hypothetical protein
VLWGGAAGFFVMSCLWEASVFGGFRAKTGSPPPIFCNEPLLGAY